MAATATKPSASSTTPSSLNFLKEGLLLPAGRNRRLFMAIFTVLVAWISLLLVANELGIEPLKLKAIRAMDTLRSTNPGSPGYARLARDTLDDYRVLFLAGAAFQVSVDVAGSVIQLAALFAAVTTYSGNTDDADHDGEAAHTFGALLGRAKQQLKGAVPTVAFVCALKAAAVALLLAFSGLVAFLGITLRRRRDYYYYYGLSLAGCLVLLVAFVVVYVLLSFYCSLAVVVAVDESATASRRRHGAGAVLRAWQLVEGRRRHAMLFISVMSLLAAVFRPMYWQAKMCARSNMASGALLLGALYAVQMAAVELFHHCALTAFYYECKGRSAQEPETEYVKLSIQDA